MADGKTLTVNGEIIGWDDDGELTYDLTVYGQREGTGKLKVYNEDTSSMDVSAIKCGNLNLCGGVIEAQTADKATYGANIAVAADSVFVAGGNLTAIAGSVKTPLEKNSYNMSVGVKTIYLFGLYDGTVTAKSGDADSGHNGDISYAVWADRAYVVGGALVTDYEGTNAEYCRDIFIFDLFSVEGGTVKSARESEAVNVQSDTIYIGDGTVKFEKGKSLQIKTNGEITLGSILAPATSYFYRGEEVDATELYRLGDRIDYSERSITLESIYIVPFGEDPYEEEASSAIATASMFGRKTVYIQDEDQFAEVLSDRCTESIKLLSDITLSENTVEAWCSVDDDSFVILAKKLTLDLNGCELKLEGMYPLLINKNFVIKDSSKNKSGCLDTEDTVYVEGYINPQFSKAQLTVESGTLCCKNLFAFAADIVVSGGNIVTRENDLEDYGTYLVYAAKLTITNGLVESFVVVGDFCSFEMTGGKLGLGVGSTQISEYIGCVGVDGEMSSAKISGGSLKRLFARSDADIQLSGGEFESVQVGNESVVSFLAPGYAFYSAEHEEVPVSAASSIVSNVIVKPHTCSFAEDDGEDSRCACGREKIIVLDSAEGAIAKITQREETETITGYIDDFGILAEVLAGPFMATITLLSDVEYDLDSTIDIPVNSNTVLDLNGYTLDLSRKDASGNTDYVASIYVGVDGLASTFTVKDSSANKSGLIKTDNLYVDLTSKVNLQGGKITCANTAYPSLVIGSLVISGGTLDVIALGISHASLTVTGGVLTGETLMLGDYDYSGKGKSVLSIAEGQEEQNLFDWAPLVPEAKETGDNLLVTGGEIKVGTIVVMLGYSAKIAGGKIGFLSEDESSRIINYGGNVAISGGEIESYTDVRYFEASVDEKEIGSTVFKGGKFGSIWIPMASESDVLGYLEDGYAYYSTETGNVTVPVIDEESSTGEGNVYILNNVEVKSHSCTFNEKGYCACGRKGKANATAVCYIDEKGNEKQTTNYKKLTGEETKLTAGWYVAEGNITASAPITLEGDVNLILTDGSNFTVNGNIVQSDEKKGTFTVYGQKNGTGSITASGAKHVFTLQGDPFTSNLAFYLHHMVVNGGIVNANGGNAGALTSGGILTIDDLTVNGGVINATGADFETEASGDGDEYFSYGIYLGCENEYSNGLTVNGGVINAIGGKVTITDGEGMNICGYSAGISTDTMVVNGGGVTAKGQTVSVEAEDGGTVSSEGIYSFGFEMNGGSVNAIGGDASIVGNKSVMEYFDAYSVGIEGVYFTVNGGKLNATSDDAAAEGGMCGVSSAGIQLVNLVVNGGSITLRDVSEQVDFAGVKSAVCAYNIGMTGGSIEIIGNYDVDIICYRDMDFYGGTVKGGADGAVSADIWQGFNYSGGNIKLDRLNANILYQGEGVDVGAILADGYTFYDGSYFYLIRDSEDDRWSNVRISNVGVNVVLNKDDVETGVTVDLSFLPDRAENEKYAIYSVDDEITASINEETGLLTVKANSSTVVGGFSVYVSKGTDFNPKNSFIEVYVNTTEKKVATVTLSGGLEKVYDGLEIDSSSISAIATVKDGEQVLQGTWYWNVPSGPLKVMDGTVTAMFEPQTDGYSIVYYEIPVKITAKQLTGEPSYTAIEEAGKTLADAALQANKAWPKGTLSWVDENGNYLSDDTIVAANKEYKWSFRPLDSVSYQGLEGTVTLYTGSGSGGSSGSSGGSGGSGGRKDNTTTTTTKNPDGSTTTVKEDKTTGTVTETTKNPDGSTTTKETEKDGTVTTTEKDNKGNTVETVQKPDGEVTTTEKRKDGTTVTTTTGEDGTTKSEIKASKNKETEVTVPVEDPENVTKITVTDADGNKTEITEFEKTENGIKLSVTGNCTVEITSEKGEDKPAKKSFKDVSGHWGEDAISFMVEQGLMNGISEDEFAPDGTLTRAMLVTILYRAAGQPAVNKGIPFGDVTADSYYADAVNWAQQNGIVNGMTENEFAPDENITREQIATIIYRFAKAMGYDVSVGEDTNILSYTDAEEISEYAVEAMCYAVGSGLLKGKTESTLNPGDNATRAELATIIQRFLKMHA